MGKRNRWFTDVIYNCSKCRGLPQLREIHCRNTRLFISKANTVVMYFFKRCSATKDKEINRTFPKNQVVGGGFRSSAVLLTSPSRPIRYLVVYICGLCPPFGTLLNLKWYIYVSSQIDRDITTKTKRKDNQSIGSAHGLAPLPPMFGLRPH